jgi:RimJ/RimL family protein N-acetyltransferase
MVTHMALEIQTSRMILRLIKEDDLEQIAELNVDPEVRKYFPDGIQTKAQTLQRIKEFIKFYQDEGLPCFVMFDKTSNEFIGRCGFGPIETGEVEVGYLIVKRFWSKGYATETLKALLQWSKNNIDTDYIIAFAPLEHGASHRVMEKGGMEYYKEDIGHGVLCKFYRIQNK